MALTTILGYGNTIKRIIFQYEIMCKKEGEEELCDFPYLFQLIEHINSNINQYEYPDKTNSKWYGFDKINSNNLLWQVVMANCKYNYKPNLINITNRAERPSPKNNDEGDKEKTHLLIYGNVILFEHRRNGTGMYVLCKLLNDAWKTIKSVIDPRIVKIEARQILDNNFMEIIKKSNRIKGIKIIADSHLISSDFFNFSEDNGVQEKYSIEIKAKKYHQFNKYTFINRIEKFLTLDQSIDKITVDLHDEENNHRIINTEEFAKRYVINVNKDNNGDVDSYDMFLQMGSLI